MPRRKLCESRGKRRSNGSLFISYDQIDMSYLRLLSYQSLSNQKQKDSPRRWFGQSLYFNPFAASALGSEAIDKRRRSANNRPRALG